MYTYIYCLKILIKIFILIYLPMLYPLLIYIYILYTYVNYGVYLGKPLRPVYPSTSPYIS